MLAGPIEPHKRTGENTLAAVRRFALRGQNTQTLTDTSLLPATERSIALTRSCLFDIIILRSAYSAS